MNGAVALVASACAQGVLACVFRDGSNSCCSSITSVEMGFSIRQ